MPLHLAYVATLPCETLMSAKQATNDKLQGSVANIEGVAGPLITKLGKVYCWVCQWIFLMGKYFSKYKQERESRALLRLLAVC